uniref:Transmembrane protein 179 n=1 Tax=Cacopsylla melanoneura TaxID=428564 RepID=A0A8D8QKB9_9HEMI
MAMTNKLLLSQIACYAIACILSLCIIIPMTLHQDQFKGHCLLFSTGVWQEADGQFLVSWASQAYCNYTIFVGVVLFVVSMIQIYRMYMYIHRDTDSSFLSAFVDVIGCLFLCTLTIIAALMITLGFMTWCENMTERFPSCELAAGQAIDKKDGINTDWFHVELVLVFTVRCVGLVLLLGRPGRVLPPQTVQLSSDTEHEGVHVPGATESHLRDTQVSG